MDTRMKIGVSACLLGEKVRYDGGHRHDCYITQTLEQYFIFVPVCPESECGLGIPREPMRLVGQADHPRLITKKTGIDLTGRLLSWIPDRLSSLKKEELCGFIFKKGSPSCGLYQVKVYNEKEHVIYSGKGLFAAAFTQAFPRIPVEEEGRLNDPVLRENFIEKAFAFTRRRSVSPATETYRP